MGSKASSFKGLRSHPSERGAQGFRTLALILLPLLLLGGLSGCTSGGSNDNFQVQQPVPPGGGVTIGGGAGGQNPAPVVQSVAPTQGDSAGGTSITITGQNFLSGATVAIGGKAAAQVTFLGATSIRAVTPPHAPGLVEVQVTNPDGQRGILFDAFTFNASPAPLVFAIVPVSGPSAGGTTVTVTGTNFQSGATVLFGGANATNVMVTSASQITVTTPPGAAGTVDVVVRNPDSQFATLPGAFNYFNSPPPTISQVMPTSGPSAGGTAVTITGNNFQPGASVLFGTVAGMVTVQSPTQIQVVTPARASGLVDVTVRNPDNQTATSMSAFTFIAGPTISSISPSSGSTSGGTVVTITGTNFQSAAVFFGGIAATSVTFVSPTQLQATAPANSSGTLDVVVQNADGQTATLASGFSYNALPPPTVTSVAPTSGPGSGGTLVTINGMNFATGVGPTGGVLGVRFGSVVAPQVTFINSTQITSITPPNVGGPADVVVINPDEQNSSLQGGFTYIAAPVVSGVSPASGPIAGGTMVTISGSAFQAGAMVTFGTPAATNVMVVSTTQITATVPANPAGGVTVRVTNTDAQFGTLANGYTYFAAPTVTTIAPTSWSTLGGTTITINGTNFQPGAMVLFGGVASPTVTFVSTTQLTAVTPPGPAGATTVQVVNPDGQSAMAPGGGTYVSPPSIADATPNSGPAVGGTTVTITGTDFQMGATVRFGATAATSVIFDSPTQLRAVTPAGTGAVTITVTNPDTQSATLANGFVYAGAPVVLNVMPNSGPAFGGTAVTINGGNFQPGATVSFGGTAATSVVVVNPMQITCTTPARAAGAVTVQVTNLDTQSGSQASAFTFVAAPTVTNVMPNMGPAAGGTPVTITGTGFATSGTVTVLFGGSTATSVMVASSMQLTAVTPANVAGVVNVQVHNPDSQAGTLMNGFTYLAPPTVTSASPNRGPTAGNTTVVITGSNFQMGAQVRFGMNMAASVMFNSPTQLTAVTPPGAAGSVDIVVTNPDAQSGTLSGGFTYEQPPAPVVNGISPSSGPTTGNTMVMITGANFMMGAQVRVGGALATNVMFVDPTQLTATTPAGAAGDANVQVTNPDGQSGTLPTAFTYVAPPTVSNVMPGSGPVLGGNAITINGANFQPGAAATIGGAPATSVNLVSSAQLTVIAPAGAAGPATVQVTNPDGQIGMLAAGYAYIAPPDIVSINPMNGPPGGATQVTVMGSAFQPGIMVFFGNSVGNGLIFDSPNQVRVNTPPRASGTVDVTVRNPDGQQGVLANAFTYDPALGPMVTTVNPMTGPTAGGSLVTIVGSGFVSGATVWFGGNQGLNLMFISDMDIRATTPTAAAGTVDVSVRNPNLETGTLMNAFTFLAPPSISAISPNSGPAAGGTSVIITGSGFQNTPTVPTVLFGATPAATVMFNSPTQLTVMTPAGAGTVAVQVTNADGQSVTQNSAFTFVPAPTITNSTPGSGPTAGGTQVTITGTGFQSGASVFFGAAPAASVTFVNSTQVRATSPASAAGTVDITVRNPDMQQAVRANAFMFIPPPSIMTVMPASGPTAGGTMVTIVGSNFRNTPTLPTVLFGGTAGTSVIFDSTMQLRVVTPAHSAGLVDVQVRNPDNQTATAMGAFTFLVAPTVLNVMPTSGPVSGNTQITITGTNFVNGAVVRVAGNLATGVIFDSAIQLRANTPAGAEGSASVQVTNPDGQSGTLANAFVYVAPPAITNVSPASGPLGGGTTITIAGGKFQPNALVFVGGNAATMIVVNSSTQIQAATPAGAAGTVDVQVTNPDGQSATRANSFTYVAPPMVMSVAPTSGPTAGGTSVIIMGSAFQMGATVRFGGTAATSVTFNSSMQLTAMAPARSAGLVTVTVTNPDGQAGSLPNSYNYIAPPIVSSVNPNSGPTAGGTMVTIGGMNFGAGATVTIGGTAATMVMVNSSTSITALTPMRATGGAVNVTVMNTDGQSGTLNSSFTYVAPPTVNNVMPATGPVTGGSTVTVNGANFQTGAIVRFGGTAATGVNVVSSSQITATLPAHAAGLVDVQVQNPDGQVGTLAGAFTYLPPPMINNINPTSGQSTGGTVVTINGSNFQMGATVTFGGVPASSVVVASAIQIQAVSPAGTAGTTVAVTVRNPDNQSATLSNAYMYLAPPAPTVTSVNPNTGVIAGNQVVSIMGSNFQAGATVLFGGSNAIGVVVISSIEISALTPSHAAGVVDVQVRNGSQTGTLTGGFTYIGPPTITNVVPNSGPATGGTAVTITGTGFQMGAVVRFGTIQASSVMVLSATQISATTPASAAGTVNVQVQNLDGQTGTLSAGFSFTAMAPPPSPVAVSPDTSTGTGGILVDVFGSNFQSGAAASFGGTAGTSTMFVNSGQIRTTVPAHPDGAVNVLVQNPDGQSGTLMNGFNYSPVPTVPPVITTVSLPDAKVGVAYLQNLTATGGTMPYNWSNISGMLPAGLLLAGSIGQIAGAPTAQGTSAFVTQVQDSAAPPQSDADVLSIFVGNKPPGTPVMACGVLANAGTTYILQNNVSSAETCFSIQADNITLDLNGRTVTYATNPPAGKARYGISGVACSDLDFGSTTNFRAQGSPCGGSFNNFTLRGPGVIQQSANAQPYSHALRFGQGSCTKLTFHDFTINLSSGVASVPIRTTFCGGNNHFFNVTINDTLTTINNRHQLEGVAVRLADERSTTGAHSIHNNTIVGSPQGGILSGAPGSKIYANDISLTATFTNDFGIYAWGSAVEVFGNNIHCGDPGRSCRGIQIDNRDGLIRDNTIVAREVAQNIEYGGCQIGGAYGIQFESNSRTALATRNQVTVLADECDGKGLRVSNLPAANGLVSRNNTYKAVRVGSSTRKATGFSPANTLDFTSIDDVFETDGPNIYCQFECGHNLTFIRPTFIRGSNPESGYVTFHLIPGALTGGTSRNSLFFQDPKFQNGASKDSVLMQRIGQSGFQVAVQYFIQWTYTLALTDQIGTPAVGAAVTITDALGQQAFVGVTDGFGRVTTVLNEFRRFNTSTQAIVAEMQTPHSVSITKVGCTSQTFSITMTGTLTQNRMLSCP